MPLVVLASLLACGLGLFFLGLRLMTHTFQAWTGPAIVRVLERYTARPGLALASGLVVAATIQSSSATNIMVVGLVGAGIISLQAAFAVILGSNIGTTITAHLITLPIGSIAPYLVVIGLVFGWPDARRLPLALPARIVASLGCIFYGLSLVTEAFRPLLTSPLILQGLEMLEASSGRAILLGALLTSLVQSSSMVTSLAVGLATDGILPTAAAIAIALGSNVGTVATTLLASLWAKPNARRAALADLFFNVMGVIFVFPVLSVFVHLISLTSLDPGRQVANAHTVFNVVTALVAFPCIPLICRLIERLTRFADN